MYNAILAKYEKENAVIYYPYRCQTETSKSGKRNRTVIAYTELGEVFKFIPYVYFSEILDCKDETQKTELKKRMKQKLADLVGAGYEWARSIADDLLHLS